MPPYVVPQKVPLEGFEPSFPAPLHTDQVQRLKGARGQVFFQLNYRGIFNFSSITFYKVLVK